VFCQLKSINVSFSKLLQGKHVHFFDITISIVLLTYKRFKGLIPHNINMDTPQDGKNVPVVRSITD